MARINVEQTALTDPRYTILGQLLETNRYDALGRMIHVWNYCQERACYVLPTDALDVLLDRPNSGPILVKADLAKPTRDGYYINGSKGRVEWLTKRREAANRGGNYRSASAKRGADGTFLPSHPAKIQPNLQHTSSAPAPALSTKTVSEIPKNGISSPQRREERAVRVKAWLDLFETWWNEAPPPRKVARKAAIRAWTKLLPNPGEEQATLDRIIALTRKRWIEWAKREKETRPHPATFLNAEDFSN